MTWEIIKTAGFGFLQLSPAVFYDMTFDELMLMVDGKRKNEDTNLQVICEVIRSQTAILISPSMKKGKSFNPRKNMPFPWDRKSDGPIDDPKVVRERILKRDKKQAIKKESFKGK